MALAAGAASYLRNVGRSLMYSTVDILKDNTPFLNSLFKESKETVNDLYSSIKDFANNSKGEVKTLGKEVISNAWKNLKDDFKTGNWYNKDRDEVLNNEMMKMMGFDMEDMDFSFDEDSFDFGSDADDISDGEELIVKQNAKNTAATIMAVDKVGAKVASSVNRGTVESANYIVNANRTMNKAMYQLNSKGFATITEAIATLNKNTVGMNEAIAKPLTTFMQNGTLFFTRTTETLNKMTGLLEELVKRTPNYNNKSSSSSSSSRRSTISDLIGGDGFSVSSYKDMVAGNIKDMTSMITSIFGMVSGGKGLSGLKGLSKGVSPMKMLTRWGVNALIPVTLTGALKSFDTALQEFLPSMIARAMASKSSSGLGNILRSIFLPKNEMTRHVSSRDYVKGPIPFDGETKKAITDVIPTYLSHILSAINGSSPTKYDYENGRFTRLSDIAKSKVAREREFAAKGGGKLREEALRRASSSKTRKEIEAFFLSSFLTGEGFTDINTEQFGIGGTRLSKRLSPEARRILQELVVTGKYNAMPGQMMMSRAEMSKLVKTLSASGTSLETALGNNSTLLKGTPGAIDKYGYTALDYLRGIFYNTKFGGIGGGKGGKGYQLPKVNRKGRGGSSDLNTDKNEDWNLKVDQELIGILNQINEAEKNGTKDENKYQALLDKKSAIIDKYKGTESEIQMRVNYIENMHSVKAWGNEKIEQISGSISGALSRFIPKSVVGWFKRPIDSFARMLNTLTTSMTTLLWGDGVKNDGIFGQLKKSVSGFLDKIFGAKTENGSRPFWNETKQALGEYWSWVKSGFRSRPEETPQAARGRRVTKTGLVAVSRGEMIVPSDMNPFYRGGYSRSQQLKRERNAVRRFYGTYAPGVAAVDALDYNTMMAQEGLGATSTASDTETRAGIKAGVKNELGKVLDFLGGGIDPKTKTAFNEFLKKAGPEVKANRGRIGAGAIVGTGVGGALGMPLLGLMVGSVAGFVSKSESAQKFLFGDFEVDENGNKTNVRKGGFFGKTTSNFLEKVAPEMARGGTIGMIGGAALIGGPFGMVGGLLAGTAIGFARKSNKAQEFLFGKGEPGDKDYKKGLFNKAKFDKALPKAIIGAGIGALIGPAGAAGGGLFVNMVLGAGLGLVTSTTKVHDFLFGDGKDGKKKGLMIRLRDRLFGGIEDLFMNTTNHLKVTIEHIGKNILTKAGNIKSWLSKMNERRKALKNVEKTPLRRVLTALGKGLGIGAAGAVGLPFLLPFLPYAAGGAAALFGPRALANSRMRKNSRRGYNIYDKKLGRNMKASERLAFRDTYKWTGDERRWNTFDTAIAGKNKDELEDLYNALSDSDKNDRTLKQLRNTEKENFYRSLTTGEYKDKLNSAQMDYISSLIDDGNVEVLQDYLNRNGLGDDPFGAIKSAQNIRARRTSIEENKAVMKQQFGLKNAKDITKAQELIKNEIDQLRPEEVAQGTRKEISEQVKEAVEILKSFEREGLPIRKRAKQEGTGETTKTVDDPLDFNSLMGETDDGDTSEEAAIARGFKYEANGDGDMLKYVWNKTEKHWQLDDRDKTTKEEHEETENANESAKKSAGILSKISSGFESFKDKIFGSKDGKENKTTIWDRLKEFGKKLLFTGGLVLGAKLLPNLLPYIQKAFNWITDKVIPWFKDKALPWLKDMLPKIGSIVGWALEKIKDTAHFLLDSEADDSAAGVIRNATGVTSNTVARVDTASVSGQEGFNQLLEDAAYKASGEYVNNLSFGNKLNTFTDELAFTDEASNPSSYRDFKEGEMAFKVGVYKTFGRTSATVYKVKDLGGPTDYLAIGGIQYTFVRSKEYWYFGRAWKWVPVLYLTKSNFTKFIELFNTNEEFKREVWDNINNGDYDSTKWKTPLSSLIKKYDTSSDTTGATGGRSGLIRRRGRGSGLRGKGFVSQLSPNLASKLYGGSTVAEAGCAPAVASMTASMYGKNLPMETAMKEGEKYADYSGTDSEYFKSSLGSRGVNANYTDPNTMLNDLANHKPVILLGRDANNRSKSNSPFGPVSHYVLATGMDNAGNVIINDPESNGPRAYNSNILNSTLMAMSTGLKGSGAFRGRGSKNVVSQEFVQSKGQYRIAYSDGTYGWSSTKLKGNQLINTSPITDYYFDQTKGMYYIKHSNGNNEWSKTDPINDLKGHSINNTQWMPEKSMYQITYDNGVSIYSKDPDPTKEKNYSEYGKNIATYSSPESATAKASQGIYNTGETTAEEDNTDILTKIFSIFSTGLSSIFNGKNASTALAQTTAGWKSSGSTARAATYIPPQSANVSAKMNSLVQTAASKVESEIYNQDLREKVIGGTRYSDCSSFAKRLYNNTFGIDIGSNTDAQWRNAKAGKNNLVIVDANRSNRPPASSLKAGDLVYWWTPGWSHEDNVSHVELYDGNGKLIGQDAGTGNWGPRVKDYASFRKNVSGGDRYLGTVRYTGSGSGLTSNAYSNLISRAKHAGSGSGLVRKTNNIILAGKGSATDGMLEQLVAAILELLTKIADIDAKDSTALANIKSNTDNLSTITEFLGKYKEFQKAKASENTNQDISEGFKSVVEQSTAMAAKYGAIY